MKVNRKACAARRFMKNESMSQSEVADQDSDPDQLEQQRLHRGEPALGAKGLKCCELSCGKLKESTVVKTVPLNGVRGPSESELGSE